MTTVRCKWCWCVKYKANRIITAVALHFRSVCNVNVIIIRTLYFRRPFQRLNGIYVAKRGKKIYLTIAWVILSQHCRINVFNLRTNYFTEKNVLFKNVRMRLVVLLPSLTIDRYLPQSGKWGWTDEHWMIDKWRDKWGSNNSRMTRIRCATQYLWKLF